MNNVLAFYQGQLNLQNNLDKMTEITNKVTGRVK